ncbi:hypothetical protein LTS18_005984, partial [Coniosporium uncinatum]
MRASRSILACLAATAVPVLGNAQPDLLETLQLKGLLSSPDGNCGGDTGLTCDGSFFGNCCGPNGKCGSTEDVCGAGCQADFGWCSDSRGAVSKHGTCGGASGYTCTDSVFGDCCSKYGY